MINNSYICNSNSLVEVSSFKRHLPNNSRRTSTLEATIGLYNYMKTINGNDDYFVNEKGDVFSKKKSSHNMNCELRQLSLTLDTRGYLQIKISTNKVVKVNRVHRLVAEAFIPNPDNKPFVNHINGIKTDNRVENLEWCTGSENAHHAFKVGLRKSHPTRGVLHKLAKLSENQIKEIREMYDTKKYFQHQIGEIFGVSQTLIGNIVRKKAWKHIN